ncbi:MAG: anthranilate phosphoribosyltransferase [Vezdaea aestivalis]|nr:MAG: anthranilate phosphoribosyltransferase [Vezdaea aestivalis]
MDSKEISKDLPIVSILPLLDQLSLVKEAKELIPAIDIANALSLIFTNQLAPNEARDLLLKLHETGYDCRPDVIAKCAESMRKAATLVDKDRTVQVLQKRQVKHGKYEGGLCDIVGTGGDGHSTFNVSTTSSIVASSYLMIAKHGNRASSSKSGSADLLESMQPVTPKLQAVTGQTLWKVYEKTNYAFLFAPVFHPGMRHAAAIRRELKRRTIFNLLGPLANPVDTLIEARVVGVARQDLGPVFAEALRLGGVKKGLVVCGQEDLDELSCAGKTSCWQLKDGKVDEFILEPLADFGLEVHALSEISPGLSPAENAAILDDILHGRPGHESIIDFVLMNTAALLVVSGICESEDAIILERGPGGGRWKEGVRRAQEAIQSGQALRSWRQFAEVTNEISNT